jgi:hypothetical protein
MALLSAEHLAGPGYIVLNIIRGLNIITLSSVVASSVVMLVKTFIVSKVSSKTANPRWGYKMRQNQVAIGQV